MPLGGATTIAGLDFSTKAVDIVLLNEDNDQAEWTRCPVYDPRGPLYAAESVRRMLPPPSWWEDNGVYMVGIEDPQSRFPHVAKALGMIAGAVASTLPFGLTVLQLRPQEWKRELCGEAKADKALVASVAAGRILMAGGQCDDWAQDAFDAYGVAFAARAINRRAIEDYGIRRGDAA